MKQSARHAHDERAIDEVEMVDTLGKCVGRYGGVGACIGGRPTRGGGAWVPEFERKIP